MNKSSCILFWIAYCSGCSKNESHAFIATPSWNSSPSFRTYNEITQSKRLYAGGFGAPKEGSVSKKGKKGKKVKKGTAKKAQERIVEEYGGDIAKGTQERIDRAMEELPDHVRLMTQLYQRLRRWDAHMSTLSVLQQASVSPQDMDGARRAREELHRLLTEHDMSETDLHNVFQKATWDASADFKAVRASIYDMTPQVRSRVDRACKLIADTVSPSPSSKCLDVGCGPGVMVPHLAQYGVLHSQITGVDLSPEMIRNAKNKYRNVHFVAADFLKEFEDGEGFDAILFCSSLHDLPDPDAALRKAASLLKTDGKLVVVHPQGASHVRNQLKANPVLVQNPLPTARELSENDFGLTLEHEPADAGSVQESQDGYLAVLKK